MKTHPVYLMFTNDTETYQGLKLKTGRNTDTNKELAQSRLYFTDVMHLLYLHDFDSVYVREVILPEGERVVKMDSKYRAENIILGVKIRFGLDDVTPHADFFDGGSGED